MYAPDRSRAKVLASLQRKGFASSRVTVISTIHLIALSPGQVVIRYLGYLSSVHLFFARDSRPPLLYISLVFEHLTNVTFAC